MIASVAALNIQHNIRGNSEVNENHPSSYIPKRSNYIDKRSQEYQSCMCRMRLLLPSSAALATTLQFDNISSISSSVLDTTTSDNGEYEVDNYFFEECSLINSPRRDNGNLERVDTGILNCAQNHKCIPDDTSSVGGRCVSVRSDDKLAAVERTLQCDKCVGTDACKGLDQSFIDTRVGCGSCIGISACEGLSGEILLEGMNMCCTLSISWFDLLWCDCAHLPLHQ